MRAWFHSIRRRLYLWLFYVRVVRFHHALPRSERPMLVPRKIVTRTKFLDAKELYQCAECQRIVSWDFGADVGLPYASQSPKEQEFDHHLRMSCDDCWGTLTEGSHAQSREAI